MTSPKSRHAPIGAPSLDVIVDRMAEDSTSADFTVTPSGGTFVMGPHAVHFPANAICDPQTSGYGVEEWDKPCEPLTTDIQIHAEVRHTDGFATVHFTPDLRFRPTDNSSEYVWLLMKSEAAKSMTDPRLFAILWAQSVDGERVNEAASDSTLRTYVYRQGGVVFRRIKHFSVWAVRDGDETKTGIVGFSDVSPIEF
jgi:hypothetical protein